MSKALGLYVNNAGKANVTVMMRKLDADEIGTYSLHTNSRGGGTRTQAMKMISESGLYKITMRSDKPEARAFQDWVTHTVLPAIEKDGGYIMGEEKVVTGEMDEDAFIMKAMEYP